MNELLEFENEEILEHLDENKITCIAFNKSKPYGRCKRRKYNGDYCFTHGKNKHLEVIPPSLPLPSPYPITLEYFMLHPSLNGLKLIDCKKNCIFYKIVNDLDENIKYRKTFYQARLIHFMKTWKLCNVEIYKIKRLQRRIRHWLKSTVETRLNGVALYTPETCNNKCDFYSFDELKDIPKEYFFSYKDEDGFIYGFHIESLVQLINNNITEEGTVLNPYNRAIISNKVKSKALYLWNFLNNKGLLTNETKVEEAMDIKIRVRQKTISYFQKIDMLGFQTSTDWILQAKMKILKLIYLRLLQNWYFDIGLSDEARHIISPNEMDIFPDNIIEAVRDSNNRYFVAETILEIINNLVSSAIQEENRRTGCIITLLSIGDIIPDCRIVNPWLS